MTKELSTQEHPRIAKLRASIIAMIGSGLWAQMSMGKKRRSIEHQLSSLNASLVGENTPPQKGTSE